MSWTYADAARQSVYRALPDGACESMLAGSLPEGTVVADPPVIVPQVVPRLAAKQALLRAGLLGQVEAVISAMPDDERAEAQLLWAEAETVQRESPLVNTLGAALNLSSAELDDLFILAGTL